MWPGVTITTTLRCIVTVTSTGADWPYGDQGTPIVSALKAKVESIKDDPEKAEELEQLRDELEALERDNV